MRVLAYGGRDYDDQARVSAELDAINEAYGISQLINGGQATRDPQDRNHIYGADWQAATWAHGLRIPVRYFYANWQLAGKAAGPFRNERMAVVGRPELGIEFPGGRGTRDMRRRLDRIGVRVIEIGT